jgi:glutamyl-tRNA reductase
MTMALTMIGLSHRTAPVEVRERLAFTTSGMALTAGLLHLKEGLAARGAAAAAECVLLSTCNRTEWYVWGEDTGSAAELAADLARARGLAPEEFAPYLEERRGHRAVEHLFRVAAGLDSMILGEPDIVRQVKSAYAAASDAATVGPALNALFHRALSVAKRVRTETGLARGAFSVGHAAAEMAESIFGSLHGRTVLLLGAGKMSETTARHLHASGASSILVANRTFDKAARLAEQLGGRAIGYDRFADHLGRADIVIASTSAPHPIVHRPLVEGAMRAGRRHHRPLFLIDIAVPRDIDADVGELPDVFLYNIDDLRAVVDADGARRRQEAERAEGLVRDEAVLFGRTLHTAQAAGPLVTSLRAKMEAIREAELARLRQRLGHLSPEDWRAVEAATRSMVNKIAHAPTLKIKDYAAQGPGSPAEEKMDTARELFGLSEAPARGDEGAPR